MASSDAKPIPQKNVAHRITFPIFDADGDLVTGASGLDSEVSKDGGTFADCTNEATEIATSSGMYYLDLTSTEMNADTVAVIVKTSTSGAKTTALVMYPEEAGDIRVNVTAFGGTAGTFSSGRPEVNTTHIAGSSVSTSTAQIGVNVVNFGGSAGTFSSGRPEVNTTHAAGTAWGSGAITAASIASDAIAAAKIASGAITSAKFAAGAIDATAIADNAIDAGAIATGAITAAKFAAGAIDAAAIANGAIDAATFAADVDAEILSYLVDDATRIDASALNTLSSHDPGEAIMGTTDLGTGSGLTSLASASNLATVAGYIDTEIAAIIATLGTPAGASVSADIAAVKSDSAAILTDTGTTLPSTLSTTDGKVDGIKAKTDQLAFGATNAVNANITYVNEVAVNGAGTEASPWGP